MRQATVKINTSQGIKTYDIGLGRANSFDELYVDFQVEQESGGESYSVFLHPKQDLVVEAVEIRFQAPARPDARFMANGFHSGTPSRLLPAGEEGLNWQRKAWSPKDFRQDGSIPLQSEYKICLQSWSYTYLSTGQSEVQFWGSTKESTGFTLFSYDFREGVLIAGKDLRGLVLSHSFPALNLWVGRGSAAHVFESYFSLSGYPPELPSKKESADSNRSRLVQILDGSGDITPDAVLKKMDHIAATSLPVDTLLIGDGWQPATGDWRSGKPMGALAATIREKGFRPGLWLAPFVASATSKLAQQHPGWFLKGPDGKPLRAGHHARWGGWYYALSLYHPGVQDYLSGLFHIITEQWRYDFLQLDYLAAVCLQPPPGKTRGQLMHDALEFLRRQCGSRVISAGAVPLGTAIGWADYCRVTASENKSTRWSLPFFQNKRQWGHTTLALRSLLARWQLNGKSFFLHPGTFSLRQTSNGLNAVQQNTVLCLHTLLGGICDTGDDPAAYSTEQLTELEEALSWQGARVTGVIELEKDLFRIDFDHGDRTYGAFCNLTTEVKNTGARNGNPFEIQPFETLILQGNFAGN